MEKLGVVGERIWNLEKQFNLAAGFTAMKLKVGSREADRDIRRARIVREIAGPSARVMVDANQQWTLPQALLVCRGTRRHQPFLDRGTHPPG